jgi:hypothetical protein
MGVVPPFSEHCQQICHHGATQFEGGVVPGGSFPVPGIHGDRLRVTRVVGIVSTAVGKVDSANERDVPRRIVTTSDDEHLLVMGTEQAYTLIQQDLSASLVYFTT